MERRSGDVSHDSTIETRPNTSLPRFSGFTLWYRLHRQDAKRAHDNNQGRHTRGIRRQPRTRCLTHARHPVILGRGADARSVNPASGVPTSLGRPAEKANSRSICVCRRDRGTASIFICSAKEKLFLLELPESPTLCTLFVKVSKHLTQGRMTA